jgi:hypothetical protein
MAAAEYNRCKKEETVDQSSDPNPQSEKFLAPLHTIRVPSPGSKTLDLAYRSRGTRDHNGALCAKSTMSERTPCDGAM